MQIVDGHCHVSDRWYEPVATLIDQMDRNGVAQAVLIQLLGQCDNEYQQTCARANPERFASVVAIDVKQSDACDTLAALANDGAAGVRLRPADRSPGADPLAIWRTAATLGLTVSCVGNADVFGAPEFFALLEALPDLPIVLEHLGGTSRAGETSPSARERVFQTARYPNVHLKLPGLGELVRRPAGLPASGPTLPRECADIVGALERFGPDRMIWGSDFPVVCSREGYANALGWTRDAIRGQATGAEERIFGGTAKRLFKLP